MRTACVVRTRFILNNFSGIGLGGPRTPRTPTGYAPGSIQRLCCSGDVSQYMYESYFNDQFTPPDPALRDTLVASGRAACTVFATTPNCRRQKN